MINRINYLKSHSCEMNIADGIVEDDFAAIDRFNLFRIVQEFVNNSIKHAKSELINLDITKDENGNISLVVCDNGVGFDQTKSTATLGVQNMLNRMRLANLNGTIESEIGKGATLKILIEHENDH